MGARTKARKRALDVLFEAEQRERDPLTLLANRSLFRNRVEHAIALSRRTQDRLAVLMIDLDNFKNVNDSLGHDVGDRLLQTAAQRLVKCTRAADTVARLGGDEFAVLCPGLTDTAVAQELSRRLIEALATPFALEQISLHVGASIGIAGYPGAASDGEALIRLADQAMYDAKKAKCGWRVWGR